VNLRSAFLLQMLAIGYLLAASPARGQTASPGPVPVLVYSNGISGGPSAFLISAPNVVSNSFVPVVTSPPNADLAELVVWMLPGDQGVLSVSGSVTSAPCAQPPGFSCGVIYGSFVLAPATFSTCITNYLGYEVCYVTVAFPPIPVNLCPGNACWFNLENATTNAGDPVYWSVEMLPTGGSVAFRNTPPFFPPAEAFALYF
jgi:hypothetical protein